MVDGARAVTGGGSSTTAAREVFGRAELIALAARGTRGDRRAGVNRLRRLGEGNANEFDGRLRMPDSASFLRVRPPRMRESSALVRDLAGYPEWRQHAR